MSEQIEVNNVTLDSLANQVFYAGFGEITRNDLKEALTNAVKNGSEEFQMVYDNKIKGDSVRSLLNFNRSEKDIDMYFFNSFTMLVKKEGKEQTLQQRYPTYYGNKYTQKEAYNLLEGRSVFKKFIQTDRDNPENKKEQEVWVNIDFKNVDKYGNFLFNKVYSYDLEKKLDEYTIKGMEYTQNKNRLLESLNKGDRVQVLIKTSEGDKTFYLEAAPRFNSLNLYDEQLKPIRLSIKEPQLNEGQQQSQDQGQSNSTATENNLGAQQSNDAKQTSFQAKDKPILDKNQTPEKEDNKQANKVDDPDQNTRKGRVQRR